MIPFLVLRLKLLWANWELDLGRRSGTRLSFLGGMILLICSLYMSFQTCSWFVHRLVRWNLYIPLNYFMVALVLINKIFFFVIVNRSLILNLQYYSISGM